MTEENIDADFQLTTFLKGLIASIDEKTITSRQLRNVGEFYMSYMFNEQVGADDEETDIDDFQSQDFMKFMVMGWYIYKIILADKQIDKIDF